MSASSPQILDNDLSSLLNNTATSNGTGLADEAEGIWSADIEQSFLEALAVYPPCGRRKIILTEEGKMYGRNELVARYIKIRTGKTRSRKQVSSHLQVLAKRRSKELQSLRNNKEAQKVILDRLKRYTSAEIVSMNIDENIKEKSVSSSNTDDEESNHDEELSTSTSQTLLAVKSTKNRVGKKMSTTTSPIKNLLHPLKVEEHSVKISEESFSSTVNNVIASVMPSQVSSTIVTGIKQTATKRLASIDKSTGFVPTPMIVNSIPYLLPTSPVIYPGRSRCSSNASSSSPLSSSSGSNGLMTTSLPSPATIGDENFRLHELNIFVEIKRPNGTTHPSLIYPYAETCSLNQHDILRLHAADIHFKNVHTFETISIDQIFDKFPRHDGLKDLFERNPDGPFFLIKFWADVPIMSPIINATMAREEAFFTSYTFASCSNRPVHISTRLCSFGKQVLEKVETSEHPQRDQFDQCIYRFDRSPLCDYMVQFIQKLRSLPNPCMMNSVLENFTVLQVVTCRDDPDRLLLCIAFVFEIATFDAGGPQYHVYKLVGN